MSHEGDNMLMHSNDFYLHNQLICLFVFEIKLPKERLSFGESLDDMCLLISLLAVLVQCLASCLNEALVVVQS